MIEDVVIVGGGPNGLMLAAELSLAGVRPVVLERLTEPSHEVKAKGLVGQVVRLLDHRGLYERLRGEPGAPVPIQTFVFGALPLELTRLDANPLHAFLVPQLRLEQVLEERALELGVEIRRGHELVRFAQDGEMADVEVAGPDGGYRLRTRYLVGCDGGRSTVRKLAGIGFPGVTTTDVVSRAAHVVIPGAEPVPGTTDLAIPGVGRLGMYAWHRTERGAYQVQPLGPDMMTFSSIEWGASSLDDDAPMTIEELRASLRRVLGVDVPLAAPTTPGPHLLRRMTGHNTRLAETYRMGRVLLVGDAAHVHSAVGGPGLNLGLQDAANLGWKLAAQIQGWAPPGLLDSYQAERHPVAQRLVTHSQAQLALMAPGPEVTALRELLGELLQQKDNLQHIADTMAGADVRYATASSHPLAGWFVPELELSVDDGPTTRLAELLCNGRPLLLILAEGRIPDGVTTGWKDRLDVLTARCQEPPAAALLIRPDGYVAWAAAPDEPTHQIQDGLTRALTDWFGPAAD